jgi:hypothetical protein
VAERRGVVLRREAEDAAAAANLDRYEVADPIQAKGEVYGVVALDLTPRPERDLEAVLRQLQRLQIVLDLLTSARADRANEVGLFAEVRAVRDRTDTCASPAMDEAIDQQGTAVYPPRSGPRGAGRPRGHGARGRASPARSARSR